MSWLTAPARWPVSRHVVLIVLAVLGVVAFALWVDAVYRAAGYPVDHATGQLRFSAEVLRADHAAMDLALFRRSQWLDFGLIAGFAALGWGLGAALARWKGALRAGALIAALALGAAGFDVTEDLLAIWFSFDPARITSTTALIYSGAAAVKYTCLALALLTLARALVRRVPPE